jgi:glycosyltransferase involved in cell wall biosynthesis
MHQYQPLVSVVMAFFNTPDAFFKEAVESVLAQTYERWELLLVDDGSTSECAEIAKCYAALYPKRIRFLEHEGHQNKGLSASRNLGISWAEGEYVAFLDSDDVWLPNKLEVQAAILGSHPEVGMLLGNTQYWYSWTGNYRDSDRDYCPDLGVRSDKVYKPPSLLPLLLRGRVQVPCMGSILVRRHAIEAIGGFESFFTGMYEDQVFYSKLCLRTAIYVSTKCLDKYRQHPESMCARAADGGQLYTSRLMYLDWLRDYVSQQDLSTDTVTHAMHKELWRCSHIRGHLPKPAAYALWLMKKWLLRAEEIFLPTELSRWYWRQPASREERVGV